MSRPSSYTKELGELICGRIAKGESVRTIDKDPGMPSGTTIFNWLMDADKKEFLVQYARARDIQAELMFEELLEIADDATNDWMEKHGKDGSSYTMVDQEHIQRSRLRVDTRKWYLSKVLPKKFGDKLDHTTNGKDLPTPILLNALSGNNSNKKGSSDEEAHSGGSGGDVGEQNGVDSPILDSLSPVGQDANGN